MLPTNRKIKKLKNIATIGPKKSLIADLSDDTEVSFIPMNDLSQEKKLFEPKESKLLGEVRKGYTYFQDNDILLAKVTPSFENGKCGIAKNLINGIGFGSSEFIVFRPNPEILSDYLYFFLSRKDFREEGANNMGGAVGLQRIKKSRYEILEIPLPPLSTQQAIVAKLDQIHAEISANQSAIHQQLAQLDELWQSSLDQIFSNEEWEKVKLGDDNVVEIIDGDRGTNYPKKSDFTEKGYCLFLNTSNVRKGYWNLDKLEFISKERDELLRKGKTQKEDIVLTTRGTIGNCAFINEDFKYEHVRINSGMVILRVNLEKIFPNFLLKILLSPLFLDQVTAKTSGSAQPQLPIRVMKDIEFPLPDLATQKAAVAKLDQIHEHISQLRADYTAQLAQYEELRASVLDQAFKGQLVE